MNERIVKCEFCGVEFTTRDKRKRFCTKAHADRSRNGRAPEHVGGPVDLTRFSRLSVTEKQSVLKGEAGYRVVMFDIEATHLKGNVGRILCCSFKPIGEEVYTLTAHDKPFMRPDNFDDGALAAAIRDELEKYDIIVGWNSKNFDVKFINARNLHAGHRTKYPQFHVDGMWSWRSKAAAWSGLAAVQSFVDPEGTAKSSISWGAWMNALGWDKRLRNEAMAEIVDHCERDVIVLENVYRMMVEANVVRSIRRDGGVL